MVAFTISSRFNILLSVDDMTLVIADWDAEIAPVMVDCDDDTALVTADSDVEMALVIEDSEFAIAICITVSVSDSAPVTTPSDVAIDD